MSNTSGALKMRPEAPPVVTFLSIERQHRLACPARLHIHIRRRLSSLRSPLCRYRFRASADTYIFRAHQHSNNSCVQYYHSDHTRDSKSNIRRRVLPEELQDVLPLSILVRALDGISNTALCAFPL